MGCNKCGTPTSRSRLCKECALDERYSSGSVGGRASDGRDDADGEQWSVDQQGLDGEAHTGQATLNGGVAKDGGGD